MSAWSGIVVVAVAFAVVALAAGQPVWDWRVSVGPQTESWSYGLFSATHTITNDTTGSSTANTIPYGSLTNQSRMAALFVPLQYGFLGIVAALVAAAALSVATLRRKLRGSFAGAALVGGCLLALYIPLTLVLNVAAAAADLPRFGGPPIASFEGQMSIPRSGVTTLVLWGAGLGWYLFLGLALVFAFGATEIWSVRPTPKRAAPKAPTAPTTPPPPSPEPPAPEHPEPVLEEVFVIGSNGLLIKHMSRTLMTNKDRDVVGGMISVLSNFVRETFSERNGSDVQEVTLGEHRFILCNERGVVVAVLASRGATEDIVPRLRHLLACLVDRYEAKLDNWGGEPLDGIEDEIAVLWQPFFLPPPPVD
jgi:hypothetical protein